jgi:hypothetical protein
VTIHPVLRKSALILSLALTVVLTEHASRAVRPVEALTTAPAERERIANALAQLPLAFEPNRGQADSEVKFLTRAPGYLLQLTATEMRMDPATLPRAVVHLVGAVDVETVADGSQAVGTTGNMSRA